MTDFRVGDRVRARDKYSDDEATFTVTEIYRSYGGGVELQGTSFTVSDKAFEFELIERPVQLPTTAGIYGFNNGAGMKMLLTNKGEWYWIDFTAKGLDRVVRDSGPIPLSDVREQFKNSDVTLNYEYQVRS